MYAQHFKLDGTPFSIAPDPRYLYMSAQHREALAHLLYGVDAGGGFVLLTGEVGAGKTTVCRCFLQQVGPQCRVAYIFNPRLSAVELLQAICQEFAIALPAGGAATEGHTRELVEALNRHLLESHARGERNLLIIDEAQNLSADVLEQLRLLTNLETNETKLLQIVLIGQPELRQQVQQPALEQLAQRIIARYHLGPLSAEDCRAYIVHRLAVAGARSAPIFSEAAMAAVHRASGGVPRKINLICDRALLAAYARNLLNVDESLVRHAADEIFAVGKAKSSLPLASTAATVALAALALGGWAWWQQASESKSAVAASRHADVAQAGKGATSLVASAANPAALASSAVPSTAAASPAASWPSAAATAVDRLPAAAAPATPASAVSSLPAVSNAAELAQLAASEEELLPRLAHAWGLATEGGSRDCATLAAAGLSCHHLRGTLAQARELDRPFLLRLKGEMGKWVLVRELDAVEARLEQNGQLAPLRLPVLEAAGTGEMLALVRLQPGFRTQLRSGMSGPDVDWLARQLARWSGSPAPMEAAVLDAALVDRVRQFQQLQGLDADGVVGPRTWMKLNTVAGVAEPRLRNLPDMASR